MLTTGLWLATNLLIAALLIRAYRSGSLKTYSAFYFYLAAILMVSLLRAYIRNAHPGFYPFVYWYTQSFSVLVGCAVIWEIYAQALRDFPGVARLARRAVGLIFVVVVAKVLVDSMGESIWWFPKTMAHRERALRTVQITLLLPLIGLLVYYSVPLGKNLKGMILGYGFLISARIVHISLRVEWGEEYQAIWQHVPVVAYLVTLAIWCSTLWSYHPNPRPQEMPRLEEDYQVLAARTANALGRVRRGVVRAIRP